MAPALPRPLAKQGKNAPADDDTRGNDSESGGEEWQQKTRGKKKGLDSTPEQEALDLKMKNKPATPTSGAQGGNTPNSQKTVRTLPAPKGKAATRPVLPPPPGAMAATGAPRGSPKYYSQSPTSGGPTGGATGGRPSPVTSTKMPSAAPNARPLGSSLVNKSPEESVKMPPSQKPVVEIAEKVDVVAPDEVKVAKAQVITGEAAQEMVCRICEVHIVGCGPVVTSCSHLFCGDCMNKWLKDHKGSATGGASTWAQRAKQVGPSNGTVPCPVCEVPLNPDKDLRPVSSKTSRSADLLLWRLLSSLKICCRNHAQVAGEAGKCTWVGEYSSFQSHMSICRNQPGLPEEPRSDSADSTRATCSPSPSNLDVPISPCSSPRNSSHGDVDSRIDAAASNGTSAAIAMEAETAADSVPAMAAIPETSQSLEQSEEGDPGKRCALWQGHAPRNFLEPTGPGMLRVQVGDSLDVLDVSPKGGWFWCRRDKERGWVPYWAVPLAPAPNHAPAINVTTKFQAADESQLSLEPGDHVEILQREASGWTFGCKVGAPQSMGWFPEWAYATSTPQ